jgi:hypothetical protein
MNSWINGAIATCRFELMRAFSLQRLSIMAALALFPPALVTLVLGASRVAESSVPDPDFVQGVVLLQSSTPFLIIFLTSLVCLLSLLLWATPNVYSELEGRGWGFVASRPGGRIAIYLGKYAASVILSFSLSLLALSLSILIANRLNLISEPKQLWLSLAAIFLLASLSYGAVFSMLGTIFFKRAMVVAAGYLVGSEFFIASIPALIGKLTLRFHLQELGIHWIGFFLPVDSEPEYRMIFGSAMPVWIHLFALFAAATITLIVGAIVITHRQYITSDES